MAAVRISWWPPRRRRGLERITMPLRNIMPSRVVRLAGAAAWPGTARRGLQDRTAAEAALEPEPPSARRVGWGFISLYTLAYMSTNLLFLAPLLVTLALKVDSLVGNHRAPASLALVAAVGALLAMVANPFFGRMSDRTASRLGMRRPWMVSGLAGGSLGILIVALAPSIPVVLLGWCITQVCFNALLAAMVAVMPDQIPPAHTAAGPPLEGPAVWPTVRRRRRGRRAACWPRSCQR